ncbi:hypothetical protein I3842_15G139900 [Carya illinoinensis]|uniref:F-box domain-containing protein n=1 Tax=Carya illinoinensis TaxID=32201 RepID=A0A922AG99_CARIL|nr:hypothetical protein I3842_15G139900 [Carya illinoinensis]
MDITKTLPEECIANIISGTSPREACRLSLVSRAFESAGTSSPMWERFLPPGYQEIISSFSSSSKNIMLTKKNLYFHLCNNPILIGNRNNMSFQIDKKSGKKFLILVARGFSEVGHLRNVCWLDIKSRVETKILSPKTKYGAYSIYSMTGKRGDATNAYLNPRMWSLKSNEEVLLFNRLVGRLPVQREDMWLELEIGEFYNGSQVYDHGEVEMCLKEVQVLNDMSGLVVHGIELRPREELKLISKRLVSIFHLLGKGHLL